MSALGRKLAIVAAILTIGLVALALREIDGKSLPELLRFLGRLHPITLHLPIGLLVALFVLEAAGLCVRSLDLRSACTIVLWLTALTALPTAVFGILLAAAGSYDAHLLLEHKRLGCASAILSMLLLVVRYAPKEAPPGFRPLYHLVLLVTFGVLTAAGHHGGMLTHGADYLARYAPGPLANLLGGHAENPPPPPPINTTGDSFAEVVQPILQTYCYKCHAIEEPKGEFRLDQLDPDIAGGPDAEHWVWVLDMLSAGDMPPENKPQPNDAERAAVIAWLTGVLNAAGVPIE